MIVNDEHTLQAFVHEVPNRYCRQKPLFQEGIDFNAQTLLGIRINTHWCTLKPTPESVTYRVLKDQARKQYLFVVSYGGPNTEGSACAALSLPYHLFVLVPKLPQGYRVTFEVRPHQHFPEEYKTP
jgi:hypothetical protein